MPEFFQPLPAKPDHPALEQDVLEWWERERTFERLRDQNARRPERFSFIDGPITANNPMGVHHAWGRTLKDVFQRYKAMRGYDQRYQNGFDCQGLWVEVEVEKALGLNSKREIEEYGLDEFARAAASASPSTRERDTEAVEAPRAVDGLGQRLLHDHRHEHRVHLAVPQGGARARLAVQGPPLDPVVSALRHVALAARADRRGLLPRPRRTRRSTCACRCSTARASRSWSGRRRRGRCPRTSPPPSSPDARLRPARERRAGSAGRALPDEHDRGAKRGAELVGLGATAARSTSCRRRRASSIA